ncbi:MAG: class I SAM-dependent methyltransferase [Planctomycetes bacterium]|nr:class I SAM-dependent methyltransferase [Planctomycetota bacterium]
MNCLACGSQNLQLWTHSRDTEYFTTSESFGLYRCRACDALSIDPVPRERLREIYPPTYYSFASGKRSFATRVKEALDRRRFAKLLRGLPGRELAVLDVGGGSGYLLDLVKGADPRVTRTQVVDFDPEAQQVARARGHGTFLGRIEDYATQQRFDLVLLLNLIEHVEDPGAVLAKARSLLRPGGVILVQTPNWRCLDEWLFRRKSWGGYHTPRHWVLLTRPSLEALVERAGLRVRRFAYTQGGWFWAVSVLAWFHEKGLVKASFERPLNRHPLFGVLAALFAAFDFVRLPFAKGSQMCGELVAPEKTESAGVRDDAA